MIPTTAQFELNRQARANEISYEIYMDLDDYCLSSMGASITGSSSLSAKYPLAGIINGDKTHRNYGLDIGDTGYDANFPNLNGWQSSVETNPWIKIDFGSNKIIDKVQLIQYPIFITSPSFTSYNIQTSLDDVTYGVASGYISRIESYNRNNSPVPSTSVTTGTITTNAADNIVYFSQDIYCRYLLIQMIGASLSSKICYLGATRVINLTSRLLNLSSDQSMTWNLRRYMGRKFDLELQNYDGALTP